MKFIKALFIFICLITIISAQKLKHTNSYPRFMSEQNKNSLDISKFKMELKSSTNEFDVTYYDIDDTTREEEIRQKKTAKVTFLVDEIEFYNEGKLTRKLNHIE